MFAFDLKFQRTFQSAFWANIQFGIYSGLSGTGPCPKLELKNIENISLRVLCQALDVAARMRSMGEPQRFSVPKQGVELC